MTIDLKLRKQRQQEEEEMRRSTHQQKMSDIDMKGKKIGQGRTAEIFEWGGKHILKLYRKGMPENVCRQEFEWTDRISRRIEAAPKAVKMIRVEDRHGAIYERLNGETMLSLMLGNKRHLNKYAKMLAKYHANLHSIVDIEGLTVKDKLSGEIGRAPVISTEEKKQVLDRLKMLPQGKSVCHFDFHPDNIMLSDGRCRVMDFMTACIGDPMADVARTRLLLIYAEPPDGYAPSGLADRVYRRLFCRIYERDYCKLTGSKIADIRRWTIPVAAARLSEGVPEKEINRVYTLVKNHLRSCDPSPKNLSPI